MKYSTLFAALILDIIASLSIVYGLPASRIESVLNIVGQHSQRLFVRCVFLAYTLGIYKK